MAFGCWDAGADLFATGEGSAAVTGDDAPAGSNTVTVVPRPGSEEMLTDPPAWVTMPYTVARPSPVPSPLALVVKNGSKARSTTSADMPWPESQTRRRTYSPGATSASPAGSS